MSDGAGAAPRQPTPQGLLIARLTAACEWLLAAAVILGVLSAGWQAIYKITAPYQLDYGEGVVLAGALRVAQGQSLYPPVEGVPYVIDPWGPVLYLLLAAPARIFGASFVALRLLSAAATLASTLFLFLLLRLWTRSRKVALIFSLLYFSLPVIRVWSWLLRADHFGIAFSLAGVYLFAAHPRRWLAAACLFVAAVFIKPTFIAAPLAVILYLLAQKRGPSASHRPDQAPALLSRVDSTSSQVRASPSVSESRSEQSRHRSAMVFESSNSLSSGAMRAALNFLRAMLFATPSFSSR